MKTTLVSGIVASMLAVGAWSVGCSSSSSAGGTGTGTGDGGTTTMDGATAIQDGGSAGTDGSTMGAGDSGTMGAGDSGTMGADGGDQACTMAGSTNACVTCCQTNHQSGATTFIQAAQMCECTSPGACKTDCAATYCATPSSNPDMACDICINNSLDPDAGGACLTPLEQACNASADCVAYIDCANNCP